MIGTITIPSSAAARLGQLVRLLASDKPGEVVATAGAIKRTLSGCGADLHDLAIIVERGAAGSTYVEPGRPSGGWRSSLAYCRARMALLTERERDFISSLASWRGEPSERQAAWLASITERLARAAA